jgi:glycosyltransferase involved in cell wall biosynthesis
VKISIIVPAFNEERLLGASLAQIKSAAEAFTKIGWEVETIVCDNNSTDRTAEIATAAGATVVFEPINQIGRARNRGAAAAGGDWFIFVDADTHPSAELFADVAEQIKTGKCLAGGSTVTFNESYPGARAVTWCWNVTSRVLHWIAGSFIFCDAKAFRKIGGFDEKLFASEEIELSKRLKKLARAEKKKIVILRRHPIVTSARKVKLYKPREMIWVTGKIIFSGGRALKNREACHLWYDGRR